MRMVFIELLNRSIAAGWLILIIILLRALKLRFPRWIFCLLWGIVGLRLALPYFLESSFSLIPSVQTVEPSFELGRLAMNSGIEKIDTQLNTYLEAQFASSSVAPMVWYFKVTQACNVIWMIGALALAAYGVVSELKLRRKLRISLCCGENVYICDEIASPFVLGILKPRIYLPSAMGEDEKHNVLLHERAHIARLDPLWKLLGYLVLCVYWFNPLVWVAFILFGRDLEFACDERVLRSMSGEDKREYAQTLLSCSVHRRTMAISPVAFGDVGVKRRIQSIVWFRGSSDRAMLIAVILCIVLAFGFLTSPKVLEYNTFSYSYGKTIFLTPCSCENRNYETGEYFFSQNSEIVTNCGIRKYMSFHVHESGIVQQVGYCSNCGQIMHVQPLYEGYQCLHTDGTFVKTEN